MPCFLSLDRSRSSKGACRQLGVWKGYDDSDVLMIVMKHAGSNTNHANYGKNDNDVVDDDVEWAHFAERKGLARATALT